MLLSGYTEKQVMEACGKSRSWVQKLKRSDDYKKFAEQYNPEAEELEVEVSRVLSDAVPIARIGNAWLDSGYDICKEIAEDNCEIRRRITKLMIQSLDRPPISVSLFACLSMALERHTSIEWKARGLSYLETNAAITKVLAMGYEIVEPNTSATEE